MRAPAPAAVGERATLASYTTSQDGTRELIGQRVNGNARVYDKPAAGQPGRSYLVAARVELNAVLEDYVTQGQRYDAIPMPVQW